MTRRLKEHAGTQVDETVHILSKLDAEAAECFMSGRREG